MSDKLSEEVVKEIAVNILNGAIIDNQMLFLTVAAILLVSTAVTSYLAAFFAVEAKNKAAEANFETVLEQVKQTQSATEEISAKIDDKNSVKSLA